MTDKLALAAAQVIKAYCQTVDNRNQMNLHDYIACKNCIFDGNNGCILSDPDHLPETWELEGEE